MFKTILKKYFKNQLKNHKGEITCINFFVKEKKAPKGIYQHRLSPLPAIVSSDADFSPSQLEAVLETLEYVNREENPKFSVKIKKCPYGQAEMYLKTELNEVSKLYSIVRYLCEGLEIYCELIGKKR